ncbi:helix-turn-helix domain-containing protein [Actinotalea sp. C106]|uniref:winged helix-turn-helix domain-containing protein n=1 Tax=Actinotalea sp. C106 TaxID=2908644 RepID=UPI0025413DD2|nr:helix-turn-helix domain-containing protein [Actinotalea sp. C106]
MTSDLTARLADLEARVAALEAPSQPEDIATPPDPDPTFWALNGLRERLPDPGGVLLTGEVVLPSGARYAWQEGSTTEGLLEEDWTLRAPRLDALAHPVRLTVLQEVLRGNGATAGLAALESLGTPGQLHHHLRPLVAAGWLRSAGRGRYEVPEARVVPLLVVLTAAAPA